MFPLVPFLTYKIHIPEVDMSYQINALRSNDMHTNNLLENNSDELLHVNKAPRESSYIV